MIEVQAPEPHMQRRKMILKKHPEVKSLYGYDMRTSYVCVLLVVFQLSSAFFLQRQHDAKGILASWWAIALIAYCVGAVLNHWCAMGIHECSHNLGAKTKLQNRLVAIMANIPLIIPGAMTFFRYHLLHHSHMGLEGVDNDLPTHLEEKWIGNSTWRKFIWQTVFVIFMGARGVLNKPSRWELYNIAFQLFCNALIVYCIGWVGFGYLLVCTLFGFGMHPVAGHYIHEHFILQPGQETYSYYGPLNYVTFNVGYHFEHHDIMQIPGWSLPKYRQMTEEFYNGLKSHRSWVWVFYNFIFNPKVGLSSRMVRPIQYVLPFAKR